MVIKEYLIAQFFWGYASPVWDPTLNSAFVARTASTDPSAYDSIWFHRLPYCTVSSVRPEWSTDC